MANGLNPSLGLAILRVVLGVIFLSHGLPKVLGGVEGTAATIAGFGIPAPVAVAWFVALLETVGGFFLLAGFLVTPVAVLLAMEMAVAMALVHAPHGWYVVGPGQGGVAFNVVLIAGLLMLILGGPGLASVDRVRRRRSIGEA